MKNIITGIILIVISSPINANLISGIDTISVCFDFSRPHTQVDSLDLEVANVDPGGTIIASSGGNRILVIGIDLDLGSITEAPETGYVHVVPPHLKGVFCLITKEDHYVKFKIIDWIDIGIYIIEWVYQDNGSRYFIETPIINSKSINWGEIKDRFIIE